MEIRIQFFASLRDAFGEWLDLSVKEGASAADVLTALADLNPQVASLLGVSCCATDDRVLGKGETVPTTICVFPPMSGG